MAIQALSNGLVAAVYTNGLVRIVRATDAYLVKELNLNKSKVVKAKIASHS